MVSPRGGATRVDWTTDVFPISFMSDSSTTPVIVAGPHQAPRRPGSLTVLLSSLQHKHSSPSCHATYFLDRARAAHRRRAADTESIAA